MRCNLTRMETPSQLYSQISSFENIYLAYRQARLGKRKHESVAAFEFDQERELTRLRDELQAQMWTPGKYHSFYIHDPKKRLISAAPFRDRVAHHAFVNVIEPIWEKKFIFDSYANRVGKGTHVALDRAQHFAWRWRYVLQCDLKQFFPAIDHAVLRQELARVIADDSVLRMCDLIIHSGAGVLRDEYEMQWFKDDDLLAVSRPRGLPIGNLTSQFWANVYLNRFDHFVKRDLKCKGYVRYVDDFLLFGDDKSQLQEWRAAIMDRLAALRLKLHEERAQAFPVVTGIPFLGFRLYPTHRRLKRRNAVNFQRRMKLSISKLARQETTVDQIQTSVRGWVNHASHGDTYLLRESILSRLILRAPVVTP